MANWLTYSMCDTFHLPYWIENGTVTFAPNYIIAVETYTDEISVVRFLNNMFYHINKPCAELLAEIISAKE